MCNVLGPVVFLTQCKQRSHQLFGEFSAVFAVMECDGSPCFTFAAGIGVQCQMKDCIRCGIHYEAPQ